VRLDTLHVELVNVAMSLKRFGKAFKTLPAIPRQFARLEWVPPQLNPTEADLDQFCAGDWGRPQIGGTPAWVQNALRVFCKTCREEMVFVAANATTSDFEPEIWINNGSGFQYHFACDACHTVSVIAQWT
jgi:hypothetical protein